MIVQRVTTAIRAGLRRIRRLVTRRTDRDLQNELAAHIALAEDELRRQGCTPDVAARLARAAAGGQIQALEAQRDQRGLAWLGASWLDVKLGLRLLVRNRGLTLAGGLATAVAIGIAAVVFVAFDVMLGSPLPLDEGDRVVAIQVWDRASGRRRDTTLPDVERWRASLRLLRDVGAFQTSRRNVITADGVVELAAVAEMSGAGFTIARVPPLIGRSIVDTDAASAAPAVVVIGYDVWQRRFAAAADVVGRELRLGRDIHTIVGVMPQGFRFPFNFEYWIPLRADRRGVLRDTGPEGVVFARLAPGATLARANAEVEAAGMLPPVTGIHDSSRPDAASAGAPPDAAVGPRVVPYTFAFTGDFEPGQAGLVRSLATLALVLLLLPPCANIAILNYARIVTRQQEFAARHALGGSRARILWQLFVESLVLAAAAAGVALLALRALSVFVAARLQDMSGGLPFWITFAVSYRTLLFVAGLAIVAASVSGLFPAMRATGRLARLGAGALAGRTSIRLGATWTTLVIAQVAVSVCVLPLAAELTWGAVRTGLVGPGFDADLFATARVAADASAESFGDRVRELSRRLRADPDIAGVTASLEPPGDEPWVFVGLDGQDAPPEVLDRRPPAFQARFNQVDPSFFDIYPLPTLAGHRFDDGEASDVSPDAVVVNRNFADAIAPAGNALGKRFKYVRPDRHEWSYGVEADHWYQIVGVVGNLPVTTDARVAYHASAPGHIRPVFLQLRFRQSQAGLAERIRKIAATVDPTLSVDEVRTLAEIYRQQRFGDNLGAAAICVVTASVLLLSAAGLYALLAFTVAQRRREIGIRVALGARPASLIAAVFRGACWQVGAGATVGLLLACVIDLYVPISQIGGLPIPGVLPAAAGVMLFVGLLAALGPARRGLRVDPTEALRSE